MVDRAAETADESRPASTARATASRVTPGLIVVRDGAVGDTYRAFAVDARCRIGRGDGAEVLLDDASVSRSHAVLSREGAALSVVDEGSTRGTWVNGARVERAALRVGDVVRVGESLLVVVDDAKGHLPSGHAGLAGGKWARSVGEFVGRFGPAPLPLLLLGETGTGKEVVADALHRASGRSGPFVAVNCAALPKELAESQLFGHRKGAFSGAHDHQRGYFAAAHEGTLFLDEVGELSLEMQAKLLRALETFEITPLGDARPRRVDVRVLSATCRDLRAAVESGAFRADLFHRLNGASIWLAPLRQRTEEIPLLVRHFLEASERERRLTTRALEELLLYTWPGNVRELRRVLEAAIVRASAREGGEIDVEDLALQVPRGARRAAEAPEVGAVVDALRAHEGNVARVARALGVHRAQIYRVLDEHHLKSDDFR